jgi:predicted transcriptional regulator
MTYLTRELQERGVAERNWQWRERRLRLGLTIRQVARRLGWSDAYYGRMESGSYRISPGTYRRLVKFYNEAEHRCPLCGRS